MYDAIVVGARCAGSPTAMLLARAGHRVLLVDKSRFPSDIMSTHYIHLPGVLRLRRWGLLDEVHASNCPPIDKITVYFGEVPFTPPRPEVAPELTAYCPRRKVLDKILVDAAVASGVELREEFSVKELVWDGDRVAGIRGASKGGPELVENARIVIGADGMHSIVANGVRAPEYNTHPSLSFGYYAYWSGVPLEGAEIHFMEDGGSLVFPTNDGQACVAVGGPSDLFKEFRKDIEANYWATIEKIPIVAAKMQNAKQEERFIGTNDQPNFFRKPYGPGWALVGDAGYHRDFITGLGITDAFRDAELLAQAIDDGFSGRRPLDEALAGYESRRNEIAGPLYDFTVSLLSGDGPPSPEVFMKFGLAMQAMMEQEEARAGS
jgi:flavin-dependent dehydrogenase